MLKNTDTGAAPMRSYAGVDAAARIAQRRMRFIETGVQLFGSKGFHGTTMRALATEAGLNNRYFYESFETMEDLLIACYEHLTSAFRERLRTTIETAPTDMKSLLRAGVLCYFEEMRDPCFARITQFEVMGVSPRVDAAYMQTVRSFASLMMESLARFKLARNITPRDLEIVGPALIGAVTLAGAMWVRGRYRDPIHNVVNATLKILLGTAGQIFRMA